MVERVKDAPGFISAQTLNDLEDHKKFVVLRYIFVCIAVLPIYVHDHSVCLRPSNWTTCDLLPPVSTWQSKGHYEDWLKSDAYRKIASTVAELEEDRTSKKTRIFETAKDEVFLLWAKTRREAWKWVHFPTMKLTAIMATRCNLKEFKVVYYIYEVKYNII